MSTCTPHNWQWPQKDDKGLTCDGCGRFMSYHPELTHGKTASIVGALRVRLGDEMADDFLAALDASQDWAIFGDKGRPPKDAPMPPMTRLPKAERYAAKA